LVEVGVDVFVLVEVGVAEQVIAIQLEPKAVGVLVLVPVTDEVTVLVIV
tara:strand:+ start:573 stop:719 length:147 start_codon:yes stop_codon:yes gene_type:complete